MDLDQDGSSQTSKHTVPIDWLVGNSIYFILGTSIGRPVLASSLQARMTKARAVSVITNCVLCRVRMVLSIVSGCSVNVKYQGVRVSDQNESDWWIEPKSEIKEILVGNPNPAIAVRSCE